ncbi:MAG: HAMP domain-containing sensor histidine kinase [Pseudomonadota bacterium]|uniref:sensor histidine kinase n=1 Tax=Gallaecimonas pentaromativorans TaxID=584787 RepID=UPI00067E895B|nr:HAMP domain-containing sensor histidine kinase [Gallaecimonas pentaromativorans]MED5526427.1 HAMP domain-containing sensor histidine kinase [Pseudomonadota bacterium]
MLAAKDIQAMRLILWASEAMMLLWVGIAELPYHLFWLLAIWFCQGLLGALSLRFNAHWTMLLVDMVLLTLLFALSGGHTNPFVSLYLLPVVIVLLAKAEGAAVWISVLAVAGYSSLMLLPDDMGWHKPGHYWGMWANAMLTMAIMVIFALRTSKVMRRQQAAISNLRERQLRSEQVMAVASQAALSAHQLATPLSVARLTADELADEQPDPRLGSLRQALERCSALLQKIREAAEPQPAGAMAVETLLGALAERFRLLRPEAELVLPASIEGEVKGDATLVPAILNLLDNAAHQGSVIHLTLSSDAGHWLLRIDDGGPGLAPELAKALGQPLPSDRHPGPGLGLFLAHASFERLGGFLRIEGDGNQSWLEVGLVKS